MSTIVAVHARRIIDQRGNPMVETEVELASGAIGRAAVPIGSSGVAEEQQRTIYSEKAVTNVETIIAPFLIGVDALDQISIDRMILGLDATNEKTNLGLDAILSVSLAVARAAADFLYLPLYRYIGGVNAKLMPVPLTTILKGGRLADNNCDFLRFSIMPLGAASWSEALRICSEVSHYLHSLLKKKECLLTLDGDDLIGTHDISNEQALSFIVQSIERAGHRPGLDVALAIDVCSDDLFDEETGLYHLAGMNRLFTSSELIDYYNDLVRRYPIAAIEGCLAEDDLEGWQHLTARLGEKVQLINSFNGVQGLRERILMKSANAVLVELDKLGRLTDALDCIELAKSAGWSVIVSYLRGETENTAIPDIAVGANGGQIKIDAPSDMYGETEYGQMLMIEEDLDSAACYKGREVLHNN